MTTLRFLKLAIPSANFGKDGTYPLYFQPLIRPKKKNLLDETDGVLLGYGGTSSGLPFTMQSEYDRGRAPTDYDTYVLENDLLKAVFLPSLGGRLWSLYDKKNEQYLVAPNTVIRPCNLALRNAWFSGGVEWNCGIPSHHPFTCDRVYAATYTANDGTPALRIYNFDRGRAVTYQMDFFLPDDSDTLFVRSRIVNGTEKTVPIYWWSNIAAELREGSRVITPTDETYVTELTMPMHKISLPPKEGPDTTYPLNINQIIDYFYKIPEEKRKFEAYVHKDGVGFIHSSTRNLKGRKMFVWGTSRGGDNWQKLLTDEEGFDHPYIELQAGLAPTQYESVPFAPKSAIEWVEAYSPIVIEPEKVHGEYRDAMVNVEAWLDDYLPEQRLNDILKNNKCESLKSVPYSYKGHPWGTLDNELRATLGDKPISEHLDFGELEEEQKLWHDLLVNGFLAEPDQRDVIGSFMVQDEWFDKLRCAASGADKFNWFAHYNLGNCYFVRENYEKAREELERSLNLRQTSYAYHGLGCTCLALGEKALGAAYLAKAVMLDRDSLPLAKDSIRLANHFKQYEKVIAMYNSLNEEGRSNSLILGYYAAALAYTGNPEKACEILERDGFRITEIREGDDTVTLAYISAKKEILKKSGIIATDREISVPENIDFRVSPPEEN